METAETAGRPPSPAEDADPHGVDVWDLQSAGRAAAMTSSEEVDPEQENDIEVFRKYLESHALSADEIPQEVGRERPFKAALLILDVKLLVGRSRGRTEQATRRGGR